jgi:alpha-beta hydrolase superfamily lysophospholipase
MIIKFTLFAILLGLTLLLLYDGVQLILRWYMQKSVVKTKPNGKETPTDVGLEYECITIHSGPRELQAWWVSAPPSNDIHKAVLIFHGNDEAISEWIPAQRFLWQHGISSLVFDYSGFGNSTGKPSYQSFRDDVSAAWKVFQGKAGDSVDKYLLALSLGTGILLDAYTNLSAELSGVILIGTFSSFREIALQKKMVPSKLVRFLPDVYNNIQRVRSIRVPLLLVHSTDDELFPPTMAQQVFEMANEPKRIVLVPGLKHNAMLEGGAADYLAPVIEFVKGN